MADTYHAWPSSLGHPLVDGYSESGEDGVLRSQFDAGPSKIRRKYSGRPPATVVGELVLTKAGMQVLDDFYWITLNVVGLFHWADHRRPLDSENVAVYRFAARPSYTPIAPHLWRAALQLERVTSVDGSFLLNFSNGDQGLTT